MSFLSAKQLSFGDSPNLDAFGRLRISDPVELINSQFQYDKLPTVWDEIVAGAASATHLPNESSVRMDVTTASGDRVFRASREYARYQPGKSQLFLGTFVMGPEATNTIMRVGMFDARNGVFLQRSGSTVSVVVRSYVSGTAVDTAVAQASWNIDPMDGTGPSTVTLDWTKAQILIIDLEYLGVGRVRFGFVVDGKIFYVHEFLHANNISTVYMTTANAPSAYEIVTTGVTSGATWLRQICSTIVSEGGFATDVAFNRGVSLTGTGTSISTAGVMVLAIRPKATFNSILNRGQMQVISIEAIGSADGYWDAFYAPTFSGGSWTSVDAASIAEYSTNATVAGGVKVASGLFAATTQSRSGNVRDIQGRAALTVGADGTTQYGLAVVCYSATGTPTARVSLNWKEFR